MPIDIRPGRLYFFKENEEGRVRDLVANLRSARYRLLIISSRSSEKVQEELEVPIESVLTLTESVGQKCIDPQNLMVLTDTITKFTEKGGPSAFLLEGLGALTQQNEFQRVLQMIGYVCESLALNRAIGIVVIDPQNLDKKAMAFLGKEGQMIEEKDRLDTRSLTPHNPSENRPSQNV